jgi:hypothetical protein
VDGGPDGSTRYDYPESNIEGCGKANGDCSATYPGPAEAGTPGHPRGRATLLASADAGWAIDHWNGCDEIPDPEVCSVVMDRDRSVEAVFREMPPPPPPPPPTLVVHIDGAAPAPVGGSVTSPDGINCAAGDSGTCSKTYPSTAFIVTLTAHDSPAKADFFVLWSGACSGSGHTCAVKMDQARTVTASFSQTEPPGP